MGGDFEELPEPQAAYEPTIVEQVNDAIDAAINAIGDLFHGDDPEGAF